MNPTLIESLAQARTQELIAEAAAHRQARAARRPTHRVGGQRSRSLTGLVSQLRFRAHPQSPAVR
jgi:hypothetical protein